MNDTQPSWGGAQATPDSTRVRAHRCRSADTPQQWTRRPKLRQRHTVPKIATWHELTGITEGLKMAHRTFRFIHTIARHSAPLQQRPGVVVRSQALLCASTPRLLFWILTHNIARNYVSGNVWNYCMETTISLAVLSSHSSITRGYSFFGLLYSLVTHWIRQYQILRSITAGSFQMERGCDVNSVACSGSGYPR